MKYITLILITSLAFSCMESQRKAPAKTIAAMEISQLQPEAADAITGVYYVNDFNFEKGFTLRKNKPGEHVVLYKLSFKNNGDLLFEDLTEFYGCGNGVMRIAESNWKKKDASHYILTFTGQYILESEFDKVIEFRLIPLENEDKKLKTVAVLKNEHSTSRLH